MGSIAETRSNILQFTPRRVEAPVGPDAFFTRDWLRQEVAKEARKPVPEGQTPWYHLSGTGFFVGEEVSQLIRNSKDTLERVAPDVVGRELAKVGVNANAFKDEYLEQMIGLRFNLAWEGKGEQRHIVCPDYDNASWLEITDKKERDGVVTEVIEGVQDWLKTAPANSFAVIVSPRGWSGLRAADGSKIRYPETQVYAVKTTADGSLQARTLRYNADILENEELQRQMGLQVVEEGNQIRRIKNTLKNVALIRGDDPERPISSFEDVVDKMQFSVGGVDIAHDGKTFDDLRRFVQDPEKFAKVNPLTDKLIERFKEYARWRINQSSYGLEKDLQIALAVTIAQMNKSYDKKVSNEDAAIFVSQKLQEEQEAASHINFATRVAHIDYNEEKYKLEKLGGCAGGAQAGTFITSLGAPRRADVLKGSSSAAESEEDYEFDHTGECVACKKDPTLLGPCDICVDCDASMGGKAAKKAA